LNSGFFKDYSDEIRVKELSRIQKFESDAKLYARNNPHRSIALNYNEYVEDPKVLVREFDKVGILFTLEQVGNVMRVRHSY